MTASVTLHVQDPEIENERGKTGRRGLRERDREADSEKGGQQQGEKTCL